MIATLFAIALLQPTPPDSALLDRFMAAIPAASFPSEPPDADETARLRRLNPGQEAEVERLLRAQRACDERALRETSEARVRAVAMAMGAEPLERLIAFYEGPDFQRLSALADRSPESLDPSERAERDRILATYPIERFGAEIQRTTQALFENAAPLLDEIERCRSERDAEMEKAGLRVD